MLSQQRALDPLSAPVHRPRVQCQLAIGLAIYATPGAVQVIHQWSCPLPRYQQQATRSDMAIICTKAMRDTQ